MIEAIGAIYGADQGQDQIELLKTNEPSWSGSNTYHRSVKLEDGSDIL